MATIVEFALKEEPLDVEKMRKCLLKQVTVNSSCHGDSEPFTFQEKAIRDVAFLIVAGES